MIFEYLNEVGVPKFFWYTISLTIIIIAVCLLILAFKSQGVSIEIANAKIEISKNIGNIEQAYNDLKVETAKLRATNIDLQEKIDEHNRLSNIKVNKPPQLELKAEELDRSMSNLRDIRQRINKD